VTQQHLCIVQQHLTFAEVSLRHSGVWDFITHGHAVGEVRGSNHGCGTIVRFFHPTRELARFSLPNKPYIVNFDLELVPVVKQ